ncbi:hypothetical protein Sjap_002610 [Stephania japonica]|uniref:Uncharacterized protein n=1 Tax=Stephania japonica TaxID=461633 RepID=A0AAP0KPT7_9MAGN
MALVLTRSLSSSNQVTLLSFLILSPFFSSFLWRLLVFFVESHFHEDDFSKKFHENV